MAPAPSMQGGGGGVGCGVGDVSRFNVGSGGAEPMTMTTQAQPPSGPRPKRAVTLSLLRKRSEHNEGLVSSLEELALHQEELQAIGPDLGRTCGRTLKILLLQNNVIERMDPGELRFFKSLEYLNLALNNVKKVEGVGGMEHLRKLDLTLNFVDVDALEESVDELAGCRSLEELFLLGNPCMGLDGASAGGEGGDGSADPSPEQKQIGWRGCRSYVVARLPNLQSLDGKEIKRSERILATQKLPALTKELRSLAEKRREERASNRPQDEDEGVDESYVADDAPTHHDPETRTKISNELYDQKQAKEKQENANQPPKPKGEKEWEAEHRDTVQRVREREEAESSRLREDNDSDGMRSDGSVKQCNQGKYQFWFEEEKCKTNDTNDDDNGKRKGTLVMRVAVPKHLSTSLIDVDVHPTYVSVVIKSKLLRVVLPAEVVSDESVARRSAASGYLEIVMPKVDPNAVTVGLGHVRDRKAMGELGSEGNRVADANTPRAQKAKSRKERLGLSLLEEAAGLAAVDSLKFVRDPVSSGCGNADGDDDDEPPPLF